MLDQGLLPLLNKKELELSYLTIRAFVFAQCWEY